MAADYTFSSGDVIELDEQIFEIDANYINYGSHVELVELTVSGGSTRVQNGLSWPRGSNRFGV